MAQSLWTRGRFSGAVENSSKKLVNMKILYFDCPSGISGDMCLAALIDLGADIRKIRKGLKTLLPARVTLSISKEKRHGITGTRIGVRSAEKGAHRTFRDIRSMIEKSALSKGVKDLSIRIFKEIALAEGKVHDMDPMAVHFHEVGAVDSIVDIVGTAIALESIGMDEVRSSPLPLGSGLVHTAHGTLPVPAPATVEILKGVPVAPSNVRAELTTPTGAAIIKTLSKGFCAVPAMRLENVGYGIGSKDFEETPNLVRVMLGKTEGGSEKAVVMETNIDDMTPQTAGYLMERLFESGALDVFFIPVQMKKNRPGILLTIIAGEDKKDVLLDVVFSESTSIGVRCYGVERFCLERREEKVKTRYGTVRVKISIRGGRAVNVQPEYDDLRRIAAKKGVPLKEVAAEARASALRGGPNKGRGRAV